MDNFLQQIINLKKELSLKNNHIEKLKNENRQLKEKLKLGRNSKKCFCEFNHQFKDNYKSYSKRHIIRLKSNIESILENFDDKTALIGLKLYQVEMIDANLCDDRFKNAFKLVFHTAVPDNNRNPNEVLLFKDRFFISDHVYQFFTNHFSLHLPSLYSL